MTTKASVQPMESIAMSERSQKSNKSNKEKVSQISPQDKLQEINQKLAEVRKKRMEFEQGDGPKRPAARRKSAAEGPRKSFHHPKLDYVMAEIVYSPYMTKPNESYSQETFRVPEKLSELKKKAQKIDDLPKEEVPFDMQEIKGRFINEVANYNVSFVMPEDKLPSNIRKSMMLRKSMTGEGSLVEGEGSSLSRASTSLPKVTRSSVTSSISANKKGSVAGGKKLPSVARGGSLAAVNKIEVALFAVNKEFEDVRGELVRAETEREMKLSRSISTDVDKMPHLIVTTGADDLSSTMKSNPFPETVASSSTSGKAVTIMPGLENARSGSDVYVPRASPRLEPLSRPQSSNRNLPPLSPLSGKHSLPPLSGRRKEAEEYADDFLSPKKQVEDQEEKEEVYEDEYADVVAEKEEEKREKTEEEKGEAEGVYEEDYHNDVAEETKQLPPPASSRETGSARLSSEPSSVRGKENEKEKEVEGEIEAERDYEDDVRDFAEHKDKEDDAPPPSTSLTTEEVEYNDDYEGEHIPLTSDPIQTTSEPFNNTSAKEAPIHPTNTTSHSLSTTATQPLYEDDDFDSEPAPSSLSVQQSEKHMSDFHCLYPQRADSFDMDTDVSIYPYGGNRNIQEIQTAMINSSDFEALVMSFAQMTHIMR